MLNPDFDANDLDELTRQTVAHARPVRSFDGEGTVESIGATTTMDVGIQIHDGSTYAVFEKDLDIRVGDLFLIA